MRKAYYVACGLVYEMAFLAALAVVWRTEGVFAAIVVAVPTCFLLSRCVTRTPAFRPVKDSLLWLGTVLAAHLLADWLSLPLYIARLCDVEIQESGALSAADGLLVLMIMAVFAMGSLSVYAVSLGLTVRRRSKQAAWRKFAAEIFTKHLTFPPDLVSYLGKV